MAHSLVSPLQKLQDKCPTHWSAGWASEAFLCSSSPPLPATPSPLYLPAGVDMRVYHLICSNQHLTLSSSITWPQTVDQHKSPTPQLSPTKMGFLYLVNQWLQSWVAWPFCRHPRPFVMTHTAAIHILSSNSILLLSLCGFQRVSLAFYYCVHMAYFKTWCMVVTK